MSAAVAAAAITEQAPAAAPVVKAAPEPAKPAAAKPEPKAEEKPKAKPESAAAPAEARQSNIEKFAKRMNADAEKDGVEVIAPENERRAKPGPKPGSKRAPAPVEAEQPEPATKPINPPAPKAAPAPVADEPEADEGQEVDEDADTGKAEPRSHHQLKAKARLRHGDVDKAIRLAFGDLKPEEFEASKEALAKKLGVGSKQWADYRRYQQAEQAKAKQLEANAVQLSQRLQADFGPMIEARKAFQAGDYPTAFQHAFGEDINSFQRKALHQHLSQDPEKVRMRQELEELKGKFSKLEQPAAQQTTPEQQQAQALERMAQQAHEALTSQTDDPELAHYAKKAAFCRRVVELRGEHFDPQTRTTIPLSVAADMARDELREHLDGWRYDSASGAAAPSSELPGQAGNQPVRTSAPRARSPLPSQAAQAGGSTRSMTRQERIAAFATRMG